MKKVSRYTIPGCCGKSQVVFETSFSLSKDHLNIFVGNGFTHLENYLKNSIIYIEDINIIATGNIGSNLLKIKCKVNNCLESIDKLEKILKEI